MKAIVVGDIMIDINNICITNRTAPEADIHVYNVTKTEYILGGAANVVNQLNNLHCNVEIISVIGKDESGRKLKSLLNDSNIKATLFEDEQRNTTQKIRLFNNNKIVNRYDIESLHDIENTLENEIFDYICLKNKFDIIAISDYNKGVVTSNLCKKLIQYSNENGILTFIDPKIKNIDKYKHCFCFKPNLSEGQLISGKNNIFEIIPEIQNKICCKNIVLTCHENGIYVNHVSNHIISHDIINVIDVTGSGDIVFAIIIYKFLINEKNIINACRVANYIARKGVQSIGNYSITIKDIEEYNNIIGQVIYDNEIDKIIKISNMNNVVFTNGCFDIIHSAHIKLLQYSKSMGNVLVVGLNSDESIRRIKGDSRPINNEQERIEIMIHLKIADYIIVFNEDTPLNILKYLKPNILVKGGDYNVENIIGKEYSDNIVLFDYIYNKSTTHIVNKIKRI